MKKFIQFALVLAGLVVVPSSMYADGFTISVKPEIPDNQQGDYANMYNLKMTAGEEKEYTLHITNKGNDEKNVDVAIVNASTLADGIIDKSDAEAQMVKGAKNLLTDITTLKDNEVTVPANTTKDVTFKIKAPKEEMAGIILGGIYVLDKNEDGQKDTGKGGMSLHNQIGYPIEIMLATSDKQVKAKLELDQITADTHGGHPSVKIPIQNVNPNIIPDLTVKTEISQKGSKKIIVSDEKKDNQLAPQAIFPHQVKLSDGTVKAGTYTAHIQATSEYGEWSWDREFEITSKEAKEINETTIQTPTPTWVYILIGTGILVLLIIAFLVAKVRKLSKNNK